LSRRGLGAAAASAVIALSFAPLFAPPAEAQGSLTVSGTLGIVPVPAGPGNVISTVPITASGHFHVDGGLQPTFDWVRVNVAWKGAPGPPSAMYVQCGAPPGAPPPAAACPGADVDYSQKFSPPYNGPYQVAATGKASDQLTGQQDQKDAKPGFSFSLAAPPPAVTAVLAVVDKNSRDVTVSWDRDAETPDVQSYWIYRKGPGDKDFAPVVQTPQLSKGARVSILDTGTEYKGGDYVYEVETRRNGASGDSSTYVPSDRGQSPSNKVTVAEPPPGTPTTVPAPPTNGNAAPPVVRGTPSGVSRNSGFSGSGSSSAATTPTSEPVTPDPGFVRGLPYAGQQPGAEGEGDNSAVAVTPGSHKSNRRGLLVPVATGAILFVGAFHLRILKKRLDEPPALA
jgi:hypothetical protein